MTVGEGVIMSVLMIVATITTVGGIIIAGTTTGIAGGIMIGTISGGVGLSRVAFGAGFPPIRL